MKSKVKKTLNWLLLGAGVLSVDVLATNVFGYLYMEHRLKEDEAKQGRYFAFQVAGKIIEDEGKFQTLFGWGTKKACENYLESFNEEFRRMYHKSYPETA
jgi:hypothetical protein